MAYDDNDTLDTDRDTNWWLLIGGLAIIALIALGLGILDFGPGGLFQEPGAEPGAEDELAEEEGAPLQNEPTEPTPNTSDEVTEEPGVGLADDTPQEDALVDEPNQSQEDPEALNEQGGDVN